MPYESSSAFSGVLASLRSLNVCPEICDSSNRTDPHNTGVARASNDLLTTHTFLRSFRLRSYVDVARRLNVEGTNCKMRYYIFEDNDGKLILLVV